MTILQDTSSNHASGSASQTYGFSHTVTAGYPFAILIATVSIDLSTGTNPNTMTATYNSVSMTPLYRLGDATASSAMFYLINPSTGSNTLSFDVGAGNSGFWAVCACAFFYVNLNDPFVGSATTANGTSTTPSISVPAIAKGLVVDGVGFDDTGGYTLTAGQTQVDQADGAGTTVKNGMQKADGVSGNVTMNWTISSSDNWYTGGICLRPINTGGGAAISPALIF